MKRVAVFGNAARLIRVQRFCTFADRLVLIPSPAQPTSLRNAALLPPQL